MMFFKLLLIFFISCHAKMPRLHIGWKNQRAKTMTEFTTYIKFHWIITCSIEKDFFYNNDVYIPNILDQQRGNATGNAQYGFIDTYDTVDFSSNFEFNVVVWHRCGQKKNTPLSFTEILTCPTSNRQCQFYFEADLVHRNHTNLNCNYGGNCDVTVYW